MGKTCKFQIFFVPLHQQFKLHEIMKKNNENNYESINVRLTKWTFPIAFNNKVEELLEEKAFKTREEAEKWLSQTPIELELYYEKHAGLFGVEAEAMENCSETLCSPYTKEEFED